MNTLASPLRNKGLRGNVKKDENSCCHKCSFCYYVVTERQNTMNYTTKQIIKEVDKAGNHFQTLYLDYVNNYLTLATFALDHNMTEKQARIAIDLGRKVHSQLVANYKAHRQIISK